MHIPSCIKQIILGKLYHSLLSAYSLANHLNDRQLIMMQRLEAGSQLQWRDKNTLSARFLDVKPFKFSLHIHLVDSADHDAETGGW